MKYMRMTNRSRLKAQLRWVGSRNVIGLGHAAKGSLKKGCFKQLENTVTKMGNKGAMTIER